jgi:hypothetical protein
LAVNAVAFKHSGRRFIGLNTGTVAMLRTLFSRMLADPKVLVHVGDPNAEATDLPTVGVGTDAGLLGSSEIMGFMPKDSARFGYAAELMDVALTFIICHEIFHIANGHVDYLDAEYGLPVLSELGWMPGTPAGNLDLQTMEMDADGCATGRMMGQFRRWVDKEGVNTRPQKDFHSFLDQTFHTHEFAISSVFRLFGDSRFTGVEPSGGSHPPPRVRQMMFMSTGATYMLGKWVADLAPLYSAAGWRAVADVERAFVTVTGLPLATEGLKEAWSGGGMAYSQKLLDHWQATLRAKLSSYAYSPLPP